jgi:hypothetical protein
MTGEAPIFNQVLMNLKKTGALTTTDESSMKKWEKEFF